jgi:hypothetical protein
MPLLEKLNILIIDMHKFNPQNCWVFGLFPSSGGLETKGHIKLETGAFFRP